MTHKPYDDDPVDYDIRVRAAAADFVETVVRKETDRYPVYDDTVSLFGEEQRTIDFSAECCLAEKHKLSVEHWAKRHCVKIKDVKERLQGWRVALALICD